ncbi:MAG: hypothetical protein O3A46_03385 [Candidatus Poribacteria bacterium]|nr:hypothetical protein [Candidatus Poribacteria bacterium]
MINESVPHGDNYAVWKTPLRSQAEFQSLPPDERLTHLCALAHLAPSSHNSQPWRFRLSVGRVDVYLDRRYVLPASDTRGKEAVVSIGCAVEHLMLAADFYGISPRLELVPTEGEDVLPIKDGDDSARFVRLATARVELSDNEAATDAGAARLKPLIEAMLTRKIVRAEYDATGTVSPELVSALGGIAHGGMTRVRAYSGSDRQTLSEMQSQADGFVINSRAFSEELGEWILPNDSASGLGMPGVGFGLQDADAVRIHRGLKGEVALFPEDGLKFSLAGKLGIESSPLVAVVTTKEESVEGWLQAGRTLAHALLLVEQHGYHAAIHAGIVEVALLNRMFAATYDVKEPLAALFRVGRAKNPAHGDRPHAPRLPIHEVVQTP